MRRSATLPELLSPAGSYEALLAAIEAGADAVYLGGKVFNARAYAANFDEATLSRAIQYAHLNGVKVYVTLNTLLFDRELTAFLEYAETVYKLGADAVIVADLGAISALRRANSMWPPSGEILTAPAMWWKQCWNPIPIRESLCGGCGVPSRACSL